MYVKITNGSVDTYPYSVGKLRRDNPTTSFPKKVSNEVLAEFNVYPVVVADDPDCDSLTQKIQQADTPTLIDGVWTVTKSITQLSDEEAQDIYDEKASSIRLQRDSKLEESDWMVIKSAETGVGLETEWATYRQALRDITDQIGFPNEINWPVEP